MEQLIGSYRAPIYTTAMIYATATLLSAGLTAAAGFLMLPPWCTVCMDAWPSPCPSLGTASSESTDRLVNIKEAMYSIQYSREQYTVAQTINTVGISVPWRSWWKWEMLQKQELVLNQVLTWSRHAGLKRNNLLNQQRYLYPLNYTTRVLTIFFTNFNILALKHALANRLALPKVPSWHGMYTYYKQP